MEGGEALVAFDLFVLDFFAVLEGAEASPTFSHRIEHVEQITGGSRQPVKARDDQHVLKRRNINVRFDTLGFRVARTTAWGPT